MSQRPPASRPASPDGQRITLPPFQQRADSQHGQGQRPDQPASRAYPPIQPSAQYGRASQPGTPDEDWRPTPTRDLGVLSMLNPAEPEGRSVSPSRRISGGTIDSQISAVGPTSHYAPSPTSGTSHTFAGLPGSSNPSPTQEEYRSTFSRGRESPRRILTPKGVRTTSLQRGPSQGTIDAHKSPFIGQRGRVHTVGPPSTDASQISAERPPHQYGFPPSERRSVSNTTQPPRATSPSQSASPSMSAVSAGVSSSQASPASFLYKSGTPQVSAPGSYFPGSSFAQGQGGVGGGGFPASHPSGTESQYAPSAPPAAGSGANAQFFTLTTSQGIYNVPVDVHQASRSADEKRARNAGASARFRQRRKEKEKEASTTIEKMQQATRDLERKVREVEHERDFYRGERDRFRNVLYRSPETRHIAMQAPPSPQSMRAPLPAMEYSNSERASRRRRTDTEGEFTSVSSFTGNPATTLPPLPMANPPVSTSLPPLRINEQAQSLAPAQFPRPSYDRTWSSEHGPQNPPSNRDPAQR